MHKKVFVTGLGALTPFGFGIAMNWQAVTTGKSAITSLPEEFSYDLPVKIAGQVTDFPSNLISRSDMKRLDTHARFGIAAGLEAMNFNTQHGVSEHGVSELGFDEYRFGVSVGTSVGAVNLTADAARVLDHEGPKRVPPGVVIYGGADAAASYLSMKLGARGATQGISAACASGAQAIGEAVRAIRHDYLDAVLVIGADDALTRANMAANANIRSLSRDFAAEPHRASRPFDKKRSGFVMSQGAAAILLESETSVTKRGAEPLAQIAGFGATSDAYHATAPHPSGAGAAKAMRLALADAGLSARDIDQLSLHGTGTLKGDEAEFLAISDVFGQEIPVVQAIKSMSGHLLGAAGVFEAVMSVLSLKHRVLLPTINLEENEFALRITPEKALPVASENILNNSFGFGGHNASLVIGRA